MIITRLQAYLRQSAHHQYEAVLVPPFTLFFHRTDPFHHFNYAIPDEPIRGNVQEALDELKRCYGARQRRPRFEFIEEFAPELAAELVAGGFVAEGRYPLMICTPDTVRTTPRIAGLTISTISAASTFAEVEAYLTVQRQGFDPDHAQPVTRDEVEQFLQTNPQTAVCFLARLDGAPASVGVYTHPVAGVTEIAGVTTLPALRRRGIATALTAHAVRTAFAQRVTLACLSAGGEEAGRVYERVGFRTQATMLAYSVPLDMN
jgi:ribosomal protein S18 acetylase RimI-like enzyme